MWNLKVRNLLGALEPHSTDSLGHQHRAEKLSPKITLHLKCSVKVKQRYLKNGFCFCSRRCIELSPNPYSFSNIWPSSRIKTAMLGGILAQKKNKFCDFWWGLRSTNIYDLKRHLEHYIAGLYIYRRASYSITI